IKNSLGRIHHIGNSCIREYQHVVKRMKRITKLTLTILVPNINHATFGIPHMQDPMILAKSSSILLFDLVKLLVDAPDCVSFVSGLKLSFFYPDSIEVTASNHEIA